MKSTPPTITEPTEFPTTGIFTVAHKDKVISRGVRVLRKFGKGYEIEALASMVINSRGKILMPGEKAIVNDFMVKFDKPKAPTKTANRPKKYWRTYCRLMSGATSIRYYTGPTEDYARKQALNIADVDRVIRFEEISQLEFERARFNR